jgi:hypothetical protein
VFAAAVGSSFGGEEMNEKALYERIRKAHAKRAKAYAMFEKIVPKWLVACHELELAEKNVMELEKKLMEKK